VEVAGSNEVTSYQRESSGIYPNILGIDFHFIITNSRQKKFISCWNFQVEKIGEGREQGNGSH
jgi:hypothetical protein